MQAGAEEIVNQSSAAAPRCTQQNAAEIHGKVQELFFVQELVLVFSETLSAEAAETHSRKSRGSFASSLSFHRRPAIVVLSFSKARNGAEEFAGGLPGTAAHVTYKLGADTAGATNA